MKRMLGIVGSPRANGNTEQLMACALTAAQAAGAQTQLFPLAGKTIAPCLACTECVGGEPDFCVQQDDMMALYPLLLWADAIIFGSPAYMCTMTAQLKAVFDRARPLWLMDNALSRKVAAAVAVGEGRWGGQELVVQHILWAALSHGMMVVGPACLPDGNWEVCGQGGAVGEVLRDGEAVKAAEGLGRRLARLEVTPR